MKKTKKFKYKSVTALEILKGANNYNNWISENFIRELEAPILEIGAGTGNISKYFIKLSPFYITDIDSLMLKGLSKKYTKNSSVVEHFDITKKPPKKYLSFFNSVMGINVLEHIKDDNKALGNLYKVLKTNGKLALLVPAKKWSYTKLDSELGHFRRYEKTELIEKLNSNGFIVEKIYFFNLLGLLSWKVRDVLQKGMYISEKQVRIFDAIVPFLKIVEGIVRPPLGISLIAIARKQNILSGSTGKVKLKRHSKKRINK